MSQEKTLSALTPGDVITVKSWWGQQDFTFIGRGAYPYDCAAKDKHPNAMVFMNDQSGWMTDRDIEPVAKYGIFHTNY